MAKIASLFAVFFVFMHQRELTNAQANRNGNFIFSNFKKMKNGNVIVKDGSLVLNYTAKSDDECMVKCIMQETCLSINLYFDQPNQFQCELLNWGGTAVDRYLQPARVNSYSMQLMAGGCWPNPCKNGGECITNIGGQPYMCNCSGNFSGKNCEKDGCVLFDFENGIADWTRTGTAFNNQPTYGDNAAARGIGYTINLKGLWYIGTFENRPSSSHSAGAVQDDAPTGTLTSPPFLIRGTAIKFLIGGGANINTERVELLIDGIVVGKASSATESEILNPRSFDVTSNHGKAAQIRIVDEGTGGWQHVNVDHIEDSICSE